MQERGVVHRDLKVRHLSRLTKQVLLAVDYGICKREGLYTEI